MTDINDFVRGLELPQGDVNSQQDKDFPSWHSDEQMRAFAAEAIRQWEAQKWRPIEEAREGKQFLVTDGARVALGAVVPPLGLVDNMFGGKKRTHFQPLPEPPKETKQEPVYAWECNECGAQEYTMNVRRDDLEKLACSDCGCPEFHKAVSRHLPEPPKETK